MLWGAFFSFFFFFFFFFKKIPGAFPLPLGAFPLFDFQRFRLDEIRKLEPPSFELGEGRGNVFLLLGRFEPK